MKKLLLFLILFPTLALAKTAHVEYSFTSWATHTVCVFVSDAPDIATHQTATGQCDMEDDGVVEIGNIQTGKTYYFRARGYNKITGAGTGWSDEVNQVVPAETLPVLGELPAITVPSFPGWTIQSINITPVQ